MRHSLRSVVCSSLLALGAAGGAAGVLAQSPPAAPAAASITSPRRQFGHDIGDDYVLVNYTQYVDYLKRLDRESDRLMVVDIGPTAEGRSEYTAIITSAANQRRLTDLKAMNRRLALADGVSADEARRLARDGKIVVWIDGGLHATEVLGAQQIIELVYQLTSRTDPETTRILDDAIVLATIVNPDGMELVSNWYMRDPVPERRSTAGVPRLYQKYIGHDNNRDFYMMNQVESVNANRLMYREWFPAIMFDHHQTGPAGAVLFAPPFRDPFNYHFDPLIPLGIDMVGSAIHTRLAAEKKPGAVMRSGAPYSTWFNGGIRTTSYFHNQIGLLTEMIGNPTPVTIPFVPAMQLPRGDVPNPIAPQVWRFRRSIDYSVTNNYAVLDLASRRKDEFLFNMYLMARNAIEKGSGDHWTQHPSRIEAAIKDATSRGTQLANGALPQDVYDRVLRDPAARDPRGFIVPADQPDFLTATKFVNTLIKAGVVVHRATAPFTVAGKAYPAGSYVVKSAQAFRAHVMDMFEPQDHPNDFEYPGGPPRPPYDVTGYTLSYSMGVVFDRVLDGFDGPFETLKDVVSAPPARFSRAPESGAYLVRHEINDAFVAVNRLLKSGADVSLAKAAFTANGRDYPAGTFVIAATAAAGSVLESLASEKGLPADSVTSRPAVALARMRPKRVGLWDQYGGSMPSGWTRWLLEQFEFPFEVVYPRALDEGGLSARFDVLIFVDGGIPARDRPVAQPRPEEIPGEYHDRLGAVTIARTLPHLKKFVEDGGVLLTIGASTSIAASLGLPVRDALTENGQPLPAEKFYIPGSLLEVKVDVSHPLAYGLPDRVKVFFDESRAFRATADRLPELATVAWFDSPTPLRSGWAWGQKYLDQAAAVIDARLGAGHLLLFGPEIAWRAQPHGTFKFLFNGIYYSEKTD
jgi:Zinc carboxypeptidase